MEEQGLIAITNRFSLAYMAFNNPLWFTLMNYALLITAIGYLEKLSAVKPFSIVIAILGIFAISRFNRYLKTKVHARPERYKIVPSWLPAEWERTLVENGMTPSTKAQYWFASQNIDQLWSMPTAQRTTAFAQLAVRYKTTHPHA